MTLAHLKRHMDRRFDRLERTKANKTDVSQLQTDVSQLQTDVSHLQNEVGRFRADVARQLDGLGDKIDAVLTIVRELCVRPSTSASTTISRSFSR